MGLRDDAPDDLARAALVRRVHEREQEADREGLRALLAQRPRGAFHRVLVERLDLAAAIVDAARDFRRPALRHQRRGAAEPEVELVGLARPGLHLLDGAGSRR